MLAPTEADWPLHEVEVDGRVWSVRLPPAVACESLRQLNNAALPVMVTSLLGKEGAAVMRELLRDEQTGRVPLERVIEFMRSILGALSESLLFFIYAISEHPAALRASMVQVYGIRLGTDEMHLLELCDLVAHLPPGCAFWEAVGGPMAWTAEAHLLNRIEWRLQVLDWRNTSAGQKGQNPPKLPPPPPYAHEKQAVHASQSARAAAWERRQARRNG